MTFDHEDLAEALAALGSATRLDLLHLIRYPRSLRDIALKPRRHRDGDNPDRAISVPAMREHLRKLVAHDLVKQMSADAKDDRNAQTFVVNRSRLFTLATALSDMAALPGGMAAASDQTMAAALPDTGRHAGGPRLVLVHGAYQGKVFTLKDATRVDDAWRIGRATDLTVSLDYDPYVSRNHANIVSVDGGMAIVDAGTNRNGTHVNWATLDPHKPRTLRAGDVIGVGRSLLVFADS